MNRILVTGGTGFLGSVLLRCLAHEAGLELHAIHFATEIPLNAAQFHRIDLRDRQLALDLLDRIQPECIIHTAAVMGTDALLPPDQPGVAEPLIVDATSTIAEWCASHNARLIHLSTDVVFSGEHAPYREDAVPHPIHRYGVAKLKAEWRILESGASAVIVRTSLIYGFAPNDPRTQLLFEGGMTRFFTDEYRNPVWVMDLANALCELARNEFVGVLHLAGPERLSRYDFARNILNGFGTEREIEKALLSESELVRPRNCALDCNLADRILRTRRHTLSEAIASSLRVRLSTSH